MKTRPILFSSAMIRALLEGRKTQTRRLITSLQHFGSVTEFGPSDTRGYQWTFRDDEMRWHDLRDEQLSKVLHYGVGDLLWVRETMRRYQSDVMRPVTAQYTATLEGVPPPQWDRRITPRAAMWIWQKNSLPSIHMPRWASRMTLEVTEVRVQRLQEIDREDAIAEGVKWDECPTHQTIENLQAKKDARAIGLCAPLVSEIDYVGGYARLWDSINGKDAWNSNPWVVAVTFKVHHANIDSVEIKEAIAS